MAISANSATPYEPTGTIFIQSPTETKIFDHITIIPSTYTKPCISAVSYGQYMLKYGLILVLYLYYIQSCVTVIFSLVAGFSLCGIDSKDYFKTQLVL